MGRIKHLHICALASELCKRRSTPLTRGRCQASRVAARPLGDLNLSVGELRQRICRNEAGSRLTARRSAPSPTRRHAPRGPHHYPAGAYRIVRGCRHCPSHMLLGAVCFTRNSPSASAHNDAGPRDSNGNNGVGREAAAFSTPAGSCAFRQAALAMRATPWWRVTAWTGVSGEGASRCPHLGAVHALIMFVCCGAKQGFWQRFVFCEQSCIAQLTLVTFADVEPILLAGSPSARPACRCQGKEALASAVFDQSLP